MKHDARNVWLGYRNMRYRACVCSKMCNEDNCIFPTNFGEWNQSILTRAVAVLLVLALQNRLIATHGITPVLSRTQKLIYTIMDNIHAKRRTANHPGQHHQLV